MRVGCLELGPVRDWHTGLNPSLPLHPCCSPQASPTTRRSPAGDIFNPEHRRVHQDMACPAAEPLLHHLVSQHLPRAGGSSV